jgi:hypothetical protein
MIWFEGTCPRCNRVSILDVNMPCTNVLTDGTPCGYTLPMSLASGNKTYRRKFAKHTSPAAPGESGNRSWTCSGLYDQHQAGAFLSGVLYYDAANSYLCLLSAVGGGEAQVAYPLSGTIEPAGWSVMPLNSAWPNLHHHYRDTISGMTLVATGEFLVSCWPSASGKQYDVCQSGQLIGRY